MSQEWDEEDSSDNSNPEFDESLEKDILEEENSELDTLVDDLLKEEKELLADDFEKALRYAVAEDRESKASQFRMRSGDVTEEHLNQPKPEAQNVEDDWVEEEKQLSSNRFFFLGSTIVLVVIAAGVIWAAIELRSGEDVAIKEEKALEINQQAALKDKRKAESIVSQLESVTQRYLSATTVDEKLSTVRLPEKVRPLMEDYYSRHKFEPVELDNIDNISSFESDFRIFWVIECVLKGGIPNRHLILSQSDDDKFSVVWEMDVVYQPMEWEDFIEKKPTKTQEFRVYVEAAARDGFYGYDFTDYSKYRCFALRVEGSDRMLWGYTLIGSDADKALVTEYRRIVTEQPSLESLSGFPMILGLRYLPDSATDKCVFIDSFIDRDWKLD